MENEGTLRDYLRVVRRRRWIILLAAVVAPAAAVLLSLWQQRLYEASAEVLVSRQNLAASLTGTEGATFDQPDDRALETQAELAETREVARRVLAAAGVRDRTPGDFLRDSQVSARPNADLIEFRVTDPSPSLAVRLATEYARQFTVYRAELDTGPIKRALSEAEGELARLESSGEDDSPLYASLLDKVQQLRTLEALQTSNAQLTEPAVGAAQVQPRPLRSGVLALALGVLLGLGLAFLFEALDTRVRSADAIAEQLGLPLLARIPEPPKRLRDEDKLVMVAEPESAQAEAFRMLRTNLEFVSLAKRARSIMITSAIAAEGKSTTVANLAIAFARAGRRVVLVDLDLRRPLIERFLGLEGRPGVTDVLIGRAKLEDALVPFPLVGATEGVVALKDAIGASASDDSALSDLLALRGEGPASESAFGNGGRDTELRGFLEVLPSGPIPPNAGELLGSNEVSELLDELRTRADLVFIDTPPLLHVGDAMTLSARVDGLLVVTRLQLLRRHTLAELRRVLDASPAAKLGFVETGAELEEGYGYRGYGRYAPRPAEEHVRA